ncbi:GNAT family N-acetyltransferase [Vreelandella zhaodongensis]|uniref:GNAT family N-acetyltransferase n=1 Tax=Vreelandella zhaodongensis TaxID=1176240 RepID=A0ABX2SU85_VREZH|nr:GNAT family N-acetyltransferase [Halomonas zhaodongensis]NYS45705.1 GNAT family N-acetyltransferase [Halomonas zhaodongensis]
MGLHYRKTQSDDVSALFEVRGKTRENPISIQQLAQMGITHAAIVAGFESGEWFGWVCVSQERVVGFCTADMATGEVLVLAVLADFEGKGVGKQLLGNVVDQLQRSGANPIWLAADSNAGVRAHGFYRQLGWVPTGEVLENGDEILEWRLT